MAAGSDKVAVEFLVEPFVEGRPGNHVQAAIEAFDSRGLSVEIGPFSSRAVGETAIIGAAVEALIADSLAAGATAIHIQVGSSDSDFPVGTLHDALAGMLRTTEQLLGTPPDEWSREEKQVAIRMLNERGAFLLRGAVDEVARAMGVTRITIYNYLNAIEGADI